MSGHSVDVIFEEFFDGVSSRMNWIWLAGRFGVNGRFGCRLRDYFEDSGADGEKAINARFGRGLNACCGLNALIEQRIANANRSAAPAAIDEAVGDFLR